MTSIDSAKRLPRSVMGTPATLKSLSNSPPTPKPNINRPLESKSNVAICLAVGPGTREGIGLAGRGLFEAAGGGGLLLIPCLNARKEHIEALSTLLEARILGEPDSPVL